MKCNKCGGEISTVHLNFFDKEGSDSEESISFTECEEDALVMDVDSSWVGYGLSEDEQIEDIRCPKCGAFPFSKKEVQVYDIVRIVCFHEEDIKETTEKTSVALTDEEIKRALLCCTLSRSRADCLQMCCPASTSVSCSYFLRTDEDFEDVLYVELIKDALILINRKDAEIERLNGLVADGDKAFNKMTELYNKAFNRCRKAEAEAIKELMFNLDEEIKTYRSEGKDLNVYAWLKAYAKEIVGDTDVLD